MGEDDSVDAEQQLCKLHIAAPPALVARVCVCVHVANGVSARAAHRSTMVATQQPPLRAQLHLVHDAHKVKEGGVTRQAHGRRQGAQQGLQVILLNEHAASRVKSTPHHLKVLWRKGHTEGGV